MMGDFHKTCHVLYSVSVYSKDDVDVRVFNNNTGNKVVHGLNRVEAQHSQHTN